MNSRLFIIPPYLGISNDIDRAMHAVCAIPPGNRATDEQAHDALLAASHRWAATADRLREMARVMKRPPHRK
jgi:hypothetical protein